MNEIDFLKPRESRSDVFDAVGDVVEMVADTFEVADEVDENAAAFGTAFAVAETVDVVFDERLAFAVHGVFRARRFP